MSLYTLSSSAERTSYGYDNSLPPPSSPIEDELPPVIPINHPYLAAQKEYIKHIGNHADQLVTYYQRMEANHHRLHDIALLLTQIESARPKYLPRNARKKMRRKWWLKRVRLKFEHWRHTEFPKWMKVFEAVATIVFLFTGWGYLLQHFRDGILPPSAHFFHRPHHGRYN
jgi:hypothetical protein